MNPVLRRFCLVLLLLGSAGVAAEKPNFLLIIADDMGSIEVTGDGRIVGYGTETGAFIRLDDLEHGYAFDQVDRAIIMSPQKVNARVVLPVAFIEDILNGQEIDMILYANNYEEVDEDHQVIQAFPDSREALTVFRDGAAMAKGTTTSSGLTHSYFANIFGPPQYRVRGSPRPVSVFPGLAWPPW